jgi:hypothetical protein
MEIEMSKELMEFDISHEMWREYDFVSVTPSGQEVTRTYHIDNPVTLFIYPKELNKTTHRVVDKEGVAHCCPTVGFSGCVVRWKNPPGEKPVKF